jgi:hypothetical protein
MKNGWKGFKSFRTLIFSKIIWPIERQSYYYALVKKIVLLAGNPHLKTTLVLLLLLSAPVLLCAQAEEKITHTIFLIGDGGEPYVEGDPIGNVVRKMVAASGGETTVLYLGDNVYPKGLTYEGERLREAGEEVLKNQVSWVRGLPARAYFIPGNHDWQHWGRKGVDYVINQQRWLDSLKDNRISMAPRDGCPGPFTIALDDRAVLVILDTQWLLHQWDKPGEEGPCEAKTTADVLNQLHDIFERHKKKRVIIAAHHPLITYGEHGGVFPFKSHLFPLEELTHYLYIPLPVLGSLYPVYRKWFGHVQDTAHPLYKEFSLGIQGIMAEYPGSIYSAGHEHALQHIVKDSSHFIVSGSAAKTEFVKKKNHAVFAKDVRGFGIIRSYADGRLSIHFIHVDEKFPEGKEIYSTMLKTRPATEFDSEPSPNYTDTVTTEASNQYKAPPAREFFLGENYRKEWSTKINAPVFDISKEQGGLKILQRGGGQQTLSLRLESKDGHEFVLRSVEKYPEHAVPEVLRKTFAQDLVQDQISASHPYAALVIPRLAQAAGIYHTNPKIVYVPSDPQLGEYQKMFANSLALFEERPSGDWSEAAHFGNSKKIINTAKVIEKTIADNDNQVDAQFVLRSRLFDLVIGDWDRHDDQWRWATIDQKKGDLYRPIPRDRDQAFFVNEGVLSRLWSRRWALPKFEGFDDKIDWPSGLSFNARYFDRSFLTKLSRDDWEKEARELQRRLTDSAIDSALRQWPGPIYDLHGDRIARSLKSRRKALVNDALSHYEFLARSVDVTGSDKAEKFELEDTGDGNLRVTVSKVNKKGEEGKKLYSRVFKIKETKEVRLYGLGGDDRFVLKGDSPPKITARIIGGVGNDTLSIEGRRRRARTYFYDQFAGSVVEYGAVKDRRSSNSEVNDYNRKDFEYNRLAPLVYGNFNPDDGLFVGGGFIGINHGFRKKPFRQRHIFLASVAPRTSSYNFRYQVRFTEAIWKWDVDVDLNVKSPNYVNNFFGMGNESVFDKDIDDAPGSNLDDAIDFYRYRFEEQSLAVMAMKKFSNWGFFGIGPALQRIEMEKPSTGQQRFINEYNTNLSEDIFNEYQSYAGPAWQIGVDKRDNPRLTTRGVTLKISGRNFRGLNPGAGNFSSYEGLLAFYYKFRVPARLMLATRVGGGLNTGSYPFYQAQVLDGKTELRGFRKTRFYGDERFFNNFEARLKLINFKTYLFPASLGILAFHDIGRVWYSDEDGNDPTAASGVSTRWHRGWGGGIWFTPFNVAVVSAEIGNSKEGTLAYLRLGFLF